MSEFDKLFKIMTRFPIVMAYILVIAGSFFYLDKPVAYFFHAMDLKQQIPLLSWITNLGIGAVDISLLFLFALLFRYVYRNKQWETRCWFLFLCVFIPNLICVVLKLLLGRARPELLFEQSLFGFYGLHANSQFWSFPSGHTTTVMSLIFGLSVVFPRYILAFLVTGFIIIATRVLLTDHYLSDVLATTYLTLIEIGWLTPFINKRL